MRYRRDLIRSVLEKNYLYEVYRDLGQQASYIFRNKGEYAIVEEDMLKNSTLDIQYIDEHLVFVINPIPYEQFSTYSGFFHIKLILDGYKVSIDPSDQFYNGKGQEAVNAGKIYGRSDLRKYEEEVILEDEESILRYAQKIANDFDRLVKNYSDLFSWED